MKHTPTLLAASLTVTTPWANGYGLANIWRLLFQGGIMNILIRITLLIVFLMNLAGCTSAAINAQKSSTSSVQGLVLEQGSRAPIPSAIVIGTWTETKSAYVDTHTSCVHVATTTTDAQGRYQLPTWKGYEPTAVNAYKPGYADSQEYYKVQQHFDRYVYLLGVFKGSKDEHFDYLAGVWSRSSCFDLGENYKNLYRLYSAIAEEERAIAETEEQKERAKRSARQAAELLVNEKKPTTYDSHGRRINIDPNDSYKKEDMFK